MFNEKEKEKVYYWMLDPACEKEDRKEGEDFIFQLVYFVFNDTTKQKPKKVKTFNTGHISSTSYVHNNKDFTQIYMQDSTDYRHAIFCDINSGGVKKFELGNDISLTPNWYLQDSFLLYFTDHVGQKFIFDSKDYASIPSNFNNQYPLIEDIYYSPVQKKHLEITEDGYAGLSVGIATKESKQTYSMREISRMMFIHPYMIFCKGNN